MKKLLSLLSVLTISGTAVPTTIAASPYQKSEEINLKNLNRNKRQNDDDYNFAVGSRRLEKWGPKAKTIAKSIKKFFDNVEVVSNSVEADDGSKLTFEWTWHNVFYWKLFINNKACEKILNSSVPDIIIALEAAASEAAGLFSVGSAAGSTSLPVAAAGLAIASAITYLNSIFIKEIIKNNNSGNGVWIGFWLNQPALGWGSL